MTTTNGRTRTKTRSAGSRARRPTVRFRKHATGVKHNLQAMRGTARDVAREKLQELRLNAAETYAQGRDKLKKMEGTLEGYIKEFPLMSISIAAGVGLLLGRLWVRR